MEKHVKGLAESLVVFREMEKENRILRRMNMNYHIENMELKYQVVNHQFMQEVL
jgi:hypothetical protein